MKYSFTRKNRNVDFTNAVKLLLNKINKNTIDTCTVKEKEVLLTAIDNLQEFIYYNFLNSSDKEFIQIIWKLDTYLDRILIMPETKKIGYGYYIPETKSIYINPYISEERKKIYLAHELGHVINRNWSEKLQDYCNNLLKKSTNKNAIKTLWHGFQFLDEVTTQDRAEDFLCWSSNKARPSLQPRYYPSLKDNNSNHIIFNTNFDYYGELQEPAILFARLVCSDCQEYSDENILRELSKRALSANFISDIINYFESIEKKEELIEIIYCLGLLKRGSYAKFKQDEKKYLDDFYKNLQLFNEKVKILEKAIKKNKQI